MKIHSYVWPTNVNAKATGRVTVAAVLLSVVALLSACASNTLSVGASLSKAGQAASSQMEQNIGLSDGFVETTKEAIVFNDAFNGVPGNPASATAINQIGGIQIGLRQYTSLLDNLAATYAALGYLSTLDDTSAFNSGIDSLAASTNAFAQAVHSTVTIPTAVPGVVRTIGGVVITQVQANDVIAASRQIEATLKTIILILDDPKTKPMLVSPLTQYTGQIGQTVQTLWDARVYSVTPIFDQFGSIFGLQSTSTASTDAKSNPKLFAGINAVIAQRVNNQISSYSASYDKSLAGLKELVHLHDSLQAGQPLDLTTLISIVGQLQTIAASFKPINGKS